MATTLGLGLKSLMGFAKEAFWAGTGAVGDGNFTDPTNFSRIISITPENKTTNAVDPEMSENMDTGVYWMIGEAGCEVVMNNLYEGEELFWHSLLGSYTYTELEALYVGNHTMSYNPTTGGHDFCNLAIGASFFEQSPGSNRWIGMTGGKVTRAVVEGNANDFMRTTFTLTGQKWKVVDDTNITPITYPARLPVLGVEAGNAGGQFAVGGANVKADTWRLTLELPRAEGRYHYGSNFVAEPTFVDHLQGTIEANVELDLNTSAGWELYQETLAPPEGALTTWPISIGHATSYNIPDQAGTTKYNYAFSGKFQVEGEQPAISDAGIVRFPLRGRLVAHTVGGSEFSVSTTNGIATDLNP
jgi:hypothetical protein